jgi:hypothetical protein
MSNRRALIEGLDSTEEIDVDAAEHFISGRKPRPATKPPAEQPDAPRRQEEPPSKPLPASLVPTVATASTLPSPAAQRMPADEPAALRAAAAADPYPFLGAGRVAVGARVRVDLAAALKRTSLERQLQGIQPFAVQEILEEALELWLHKHGLLK